MSFHSYTSEMLAEDRRRAEAMHRDVVDGISRGSVGILRRLVRIAAVLVVAYFLLAIRISAWKIPPVETLVRSLCG